MKNSTIEERPWGSFETFTSNETSTIKIITVKAGEAFSLQKHTNRDEWWRILSGKGKVTIGEATSPLSIGDTFFVPKDTLHRIEAGNVDVVFLEISFGEFNENDIIRVDDRYGRV